MQKAATYETRTVKMAIRSYTRNGKLLQRPIACKPHRYGLVTVLANIRVLQSWFYWKPSQQMKASLSKTDTQGITTPSLVKIKGSRTSEGKLSVFMASLIIATSQTKMSAS